MRVPESRGSGVKKRRLKKKDLLHGMATHKVDVDASLAAQFGTKLLSKKARHKAQKLRWGSGY